MIHLVKIAVGGARGRVGSCIVKLTQEDPQTQLMASVVRPGTSENPIEFSPGLSSVTTPFDVFIDFSCVESLDEHLDYCADRKQAMVIGITGINKQQEEHIKKAAKMIPIVYSPNMSIGINLCFKLMEIAAKVLNPDDVGVAIHETHRLHKKDMPSGTALKMAEIIAKTWGETLPTPNIHIASSRVADILGEHRVLFSAPEERLELLHKTENRAIYARGAIKAAKWVVCKPPGLYDMQDVLALRGK